MGCHWRWWQKAFGSLFSRLTAGETFGKEARLAPFDRPPLTVDLACLGSGAMEQRASTANEVWCQGGTWEEHVTSRQTWISKAR